MFEILNKDDRRIRHLKCGETFTVNNIYVWNKTQKCPFCDVHSKYRNFDFLKKIIKNKDDSLELLDGTKYTKPATIKHSCGFTFNINNFKTWYLNGVICPVCCDGSKMLTADVISEKIKRAFNNEIVILDIPEKCNAKTKIHVNDITCDHDSFMISWDKLKSGQRCPKCGKARGGPNRLSLDDLNYRMTNNPEYFKDITILNLNDYINARSILEVKCNICGEIRKTSAWNIFYNMRKCQCISRSKAEEIAQAYLTKNNITFSHNVRGLISENSRLEIDLILNDIYIEFDGEFHFPGVIEFNSTDFDFRQQKIVENDMLKLDSSIKNKKYYISIPYWEFNNIENILSVIISGKIPLEYDLTIVKDGELLKQYDYPINNS